MGVGRRVPHGLSDTPVSDQVEDEVLPDVQGFLPLTQVVVEGPTHYDFPLSRRSLSSRMTLEGIGSGPGPTTPPDLDPVWNGKRGTVEEKTTTPSPTLYFHEGVEPGPGCTGVRVLH